MALHALAAEEFVAARDARVRALRSGGDKDLAAAVAKLRRPTPAAWALNQLAGRSPARLQAAIDRAVELRDASDAAIGGDASSLREATARERVATREAVDEAAELLGSRGPSLRPLLEGTIRAAAFDDEVRHALLLGVLEKHHDSSGFGFTAATPTPRLRLVTPARRSEDRERSERKVREMEARAAELATAAEAAAATALAAQVAADQARERAERAASAAADARRELDGSA